MERPENLMLQTIKYNMHGWDKHVAYAEQQLDRLRRFNDNYAYWHQKSLDVAEHNRDVLYQLMLDLNARRGRITWATIKATSLVNLITRRHEGGDITSRWDPSHIDQVRGAFNSLSTAQRAAIRNRSSELATAHDILAGTAPRDAGDNPTRVMYAAYTVPEVHRRLPPALQREIGRIIKATPTKLSWPVSQTIPLRVMAPGVAPRAVTLEELAREYGITLADSATKRETLDAIARISDEMISREVRIYAGRFNWNRFKGLLRSLAATSVEVIDHEHGVRHANLLEDYSFAHLFPPHRQAEIARLENQPGGKARVIQQLPHAIFASVNDLNALSSALVAAHDKATEAATRASRDAQDERIYRIRTEGSAGGGPTGGLIGLIAPLIDEMTRLVEERRTGGSPTSSVP